MIAENFKRPSITTAVYLPDFFLSNELLAARNIYKRPKPGKDPELLTAQGIESATGMKGRYIAREDETVIDMAHSVFDKTKIEPRNIDVVIFPTSHPTGENSAKRFSTDLGLNLNDSNLLDVHYACSGFVHSLVDLKLNEEFFMGKKILIVASEKYSPTVKDLREPGATTEDPNLGQTLMGDYAGLFYGEYGKDFEVGEYEDYSLPPEMANVIQMVIEKDKMVEPYDAIDIPHSPFFKQDGAAVYGAMRNRVVDTILRVIDQQRIDYEDIASIVPHQGSGPMVERGIREQMAKFNESLAEKIISDYLDGNSSSVSVIKALHRAISEEKIWANSYNVLAGFGAGPYISVVGVTLN